MCNISPRPGLGPQYEALNPTLLYTDRQESISYVTDITWL